jgi:hypothetical protein
MVAESNEEHPGDVGGLAEPKSCGAEFLQDCDPRRATIFQIYQISHPKEAQNELVPTKYLIWYCTLTFRRSQCAEAEVRSLESGPIDIHRQDKVHGSQAQRHSNAMITSYRSYDQICR